MAAIAEISGLYKFFDAGGVSTPVLNEVDFQVETGEFVCIMGPSGSGKSTLLHMISGLDAPSGGTVALQGQDLRPMSEHRRTVTRRRTIGYVFQFFNLVPNLTVLENVGLPLAIQGRRPRSRRKQVLELLERFGLSDRVRHFPHQLSAGQMQRVALVRALVGEQPLLLCDEPTGNLSQSAGLEVMQALRQVCDQAGRSILLVTHNPRDATFADRILFLVDGHLDEEHELRGPGLGVERVHEALLELGI